MEQHTGAGSAAFVRPDHALSHDARLGGAALHTQGLERGLAIAAALPPRPFLRPAEHRDLNMERAMVARQADRFHTRDVGQFYPHELGLWRAGVWRNEWHYGRRGWWWEADGGWYAYPQPVLPYPDVVAVPIVYEQPVIDGPDLSAQEGLAVTPGDPAAQSGGAFGPGDASAQAAPETAGSSPPASGIPPLPAAPVGWYRCYAPSGVYPGVASCGVPWELVQTPPLPGEL